MYFGAYNCGSFVYTVLPKLQRRREKSEMGQNKVVSGFTNGKVYMACGELVICMFNLAKNNRSLTRSFLVKYINTVSLKLSVSK